nr:MAG TPA: hypothetical protein [Caudoviricetes sp.]
MQSTSTCCNTYPQRHPKPSSEGFSLLVQGCRMTTGKYCN